MMRARIGEQGGWTLMELMVAMGLMLIVIGATLTTLVNFQRNSRLNDQRNDAQEQARRTIDNVAKDLRNLADPTNQALSIEQLAGNDLVFRTVDPQATGTDGNIVGVRRVRYCLNSSEGIVYLERQRWTTSAVPSIPSTTTCGSSDAWTGACATNSTCTREVAAQSVTNARSASHPIFSFDTATAPTVSFVTPRFYVDVNAAAKSPKEIVISSGIDLRNQNRVPIAVMDEPVPSSATQVMLNGSASTDPENAQLTYQWLSTPSGGTEAALAPGQAGVPTYTATLTAPGTYSIRLKVTDPGGLVSYSDPRTVTLP